MTTQPSIVSDFKPQASGLRPRVARGFTLVEMLVVIAIIAVLAGLGTAGAMMAIGAARATKMKLEVDQLDMAMKAYKDKYGAYPPCDLRTGIPVAENALKAHIALAFPRANINQALTDLGNYVNRNEFRPDQALVLWLGGFNPDPTRPFLNLNDLSALPKAQRTQPFFDFPTTQLVTYHTGPPITGECQSYFPSGSKKKIPVVFFDAPRIAPTNAMGLTFDFGSVGGTSEAGVAAPYLIDNDGDNTPDNIANPDSVQIIAAGLDDRYGTNTAGGGGATRIFPSGFGYEGPPSQGDDDNVANFATKARLIDAKP